MLALAGDFGFGQVVGVGEYLLDPSRNIAEVAFSINKKFQGKGLGRIFLKTTFDEDFVALSCSFDKLDK
ncbi:MAG: hypothetical protein B6I22_04065 [Desulfobacteraceae bacterium 4572_123]|nr:MAG: hypothetical protein B6I22_04065 [Desulfobacteraceae bacterium 4572_123]